MSNMAKRLTRQKEALQFLVANADILEEALIYWSAKDYNGEDEGYKVINAMFDIIDDIKDLAPIDTSVATLFQSAEELEGVYHEDF